MAAPDGRYHIEARVASAPPARERQPLTAEELGKALLFELPAQHRGRLAMLDFGNAMVAEVLGVKWGTGVRGYYVALEIGPVRPQGIED